MSELYTSHERNSLRFYQGDFDNYEILTEADQRKYNSEFYHAKGSYNVLNFLLHPGINNEIARICREKKDIPIELLRNLGEILYIYQNIFTAMKKFQNNVKDKENAYYLYRKDRMQSMDMIEAGYTFGFTACSLVDEIDRYFLKKDGILLLEMRVPKSIPHVSLNTVLGKNRYEKQEEILLPPFITFSKKSCSFTDVELGYRDINHEAPKAKYYLEITGIYSNIDYEYNEGFLQADTLRKAVQFLQKLKNGESISEEEKSRYCKWKGQVQKEVNKLFWNVEKRI